MSCESREESGERYETSQFRNSTYAILRSKNHLNHQERRNKQTVKQNNKQREEEKKTNTQSPI